ncbi:ligand-effect modulator 3 family [Spinellus fusiger]|nr:ligand-effect modulator 3 family [Spinellus fusiger]
MTLHGPVLMYYRLTNFYQNRRQYIKSYDANQLLGSAISLSTAESSCSPVGESEEGLIVYPCGLMANSMFNDTASNLTNIQTQATYTFSSTNIAWPTDLQKYKPTAYTMGSIVPPPNWASRYPKGRYDPDHPPPDLSTMEHFMVWMHVAALPDFRKLWGRNDNDDLVAGRWRIVIDSNFNTVQYKGTKWLVLSTTTPLGGRNLRLGMTYMAMGGLCLFLGVFFSLRQSIKPRKLGDPSYLSWNQPGGGLPMAVQDYCQPHFKPVSDGPYELDLSKLNNPFEVVQKTTTPPTTRTTQVSLNLCDALPVPEKDLDDACPSGTYICRRILYTKKEIDTVVEVQPIAVDDKEKKLEAVLKAPEGKEDLSENGVAYTLELGGGKVNGKEQSAHITLECDTSLPRTEKPTGPTVLNYSNNKLSLHWKTPYACATKPGEKVPEKGDQKEDTQHEGMSGMGIFFTTVASLLALYFVAGAVYNFRTHNARGLDLIPHRDFWLDLPYLIKDIFSHFKDVALSHRRGSGGYVAV